MGRRFTAEDRREIQQNIVKQARQKFTKDGFQQTSIAGITQAVGIAQGSFYNFFPSKEALYFHILMDEEHYFHDKLLNYPFKHSSSPEQALKQLLTEILSDVERHPLLRQLFIGGELIDLQQRLSQDSLAENLSKDHKIFETILSNWRAQGIVIEHPPEIVASIFRAVFVLIAHKQTIGEKFYGSTMDFIVTSFAKQLIDL